MTDKELVKIWMQGKGYSTFTIPKRFAKKYSLDVATHAVIEDVSNGLLLKRLEMLD
jgi:hypothetical protein